MATSFSSFTSPAFTRRCKYNCTEYTGIPNLLAISSSRGQLFLNLRRNPMPIRVELQALTTSDFERILTEPNASITVQYKALMATEGVNIEFTDSGIKRIAEAAWQVNESTENIGARRLHTVLERLMEEISYDASDLSGQNPAFDFLYSSLILFTFCSSMILSFPKNSFSILHYFLIFVYPAVFSWNNFPEMRKVPPLFQHIFFALHLSALLSAVLQTECL